MKSPFFKNFAKLLNKSFLTYDVEQIYTIILEDWDNGIYNECRPYIGTADMANPEIGTKVIGIKPPSLLAR